MVEKKKKINGPKCIQEVPILPEWEALRNHLAYLFFLQGISVEVVIFPPIGILLLVLLACTESSFLRTIQTIV